MNYKEETMKRDCDKDSNYNWGYCDGKVFEKARAEDLVAALEKSHLALKLMVIQFNGDMPGFTAQEIFDKATYTLDLIESVLPAYLQDKSGV